MLFNTLITAAFAATAVIASPVHHSGHHRSKGGNKHHVGTKGGYGSSGKGSKSGTTKSGNSTTLNEFFKSHGKLYWGTCADQNILQEPGVAKFIAHEFGCVTPENSMKWSVTEPHNGSFNFAPADYLVKFAEENNLLIRGHTFLWWDMLPDYVKAIRDKATLTKLLENHIATVGGRYKGKIYAWDVLNEIFNQDGSFRSTVFYQVLGEEYVHIAFKAAAKADPHAKLYINDFNLDDPNSLKLKSMIKWVTKWRQEGLQIDGIGTQSHLMPGMGKGAAAALKLLSKAAPEIAITELDITSAPVEDYKAITQGCIEVENCIGITSWGARDSDSWLAKKTPLLFDQDFKPKAAAQAILAM